MIVDADNSNIIASDGYVIAFLDCKAKKIKSIYQVEKSLFLKNEDDIDYEVTWNKSGEMQIKKTSPSEGIWESINQINQNLERKKKVIERFSNPKNVFYSNQFDVVYQYPLLMKNQESKTKAKLGREEEQKIEVKRVKKEQSLVEKIMKQRNGNNKGETIEMKKEMLKQIRKDIGTKMRELSEEYKTEQSNIGTEEIQEPEGVSKEILDLYATIKAEKKSLYREKEKKKKQSRQNKSEY